MAKFKRSKTQYPGVFFIEGKHVSTGKPEKVFYIRYRRDGVEKEERVGRESQNKMTAAKANKIRSLRIDGDMLSNAEQRAEEKAAIEEEKGRWTILRLWEEYKAQKVAYKGKAPDENRFNLHLKPFFGSKVPGEIITLDVDRVRVKMLKTKAPQTVKNTLELLRRIINFGVKRGLCPRPESLHIEFPKTDNIKTEDLSPDQLESLLKAIEEAKEKSPAWCMAANIMLMALYTGMRRGELFRLQWRDVDTEKGFIFLRDPKGGVSQKIPLNDAAHGVLDGQERTGSEYVFSGRGGNRRRDCRIIPLIAEKAGLPRSFRPLHGLRHVYASMLASSGEVDIYTLQKLLTHKSAAMTQRYAHLRDDALKRASAVANDIFCGIGKKKDSKIVNLEGHRK